MTKARGLLVSALSCAVSLSVVSCGGDDGDEAKPEAKTEFPNWPSYGGDLGNARANTQETLLSADNVGKLEEVWSFDAKGVTSTPVLYGDTLYFADWLGNVFAVDPKTGDEKWKTPVKNQVNSTLAVTRDQVFVASMGAVVHALDRKTGDELWKSEKLATETGAAIWSSPIYVDGMVIVGLGSFQVFSRENETGRGSVVALDAESGDVIWQTYTTKVDATDGPGVSVWSTVAVDEDRRLVYIGTGQAYRQPAGPLSDSLIALRIDNGELEWSTQFTENDVFTSLNPSGPDYDVGAAPNLFKIGERDVVGVGDKAGKYHVLDRDDGTVVWSVQLTPGSNNGGVMASAAYHDGVIYVASNDGTSGRIGGPAAGPKEQVTFALDAKDGKVLWETPLAPATFGAVSYANGVVYVPTIDGALHALDAENGDVLFEKTKGTSAAGGPTVANGMVFVAQGWEWQPSGTLQGGMTAYALPKKD